ncbi:MAG: hypothetical protein ACE5FL_00490 [Myxococcota bacterium]
MNPAFVIGIAALAVLVVGWLVVSFSEPSPRRAVIEWLAATAMYTVLLMLFVHMVRRAIENDSTVALVAFGFLCFLFGGGLLVAAYRTIAAIRGDGESGSSATN